MSRPALVGPVTGRDPFTGRLCQEQVVFCSESCRQRYAQACPELIEAGWTNTEVDDVYARNPFGHAYWKPACSTCGALLLQTTVDDDAGAS
jgi:hypothetical protein